jgi:hypothetical protein
MVDASCRGCWYVLRHLACQSQDPVIWDAFRRYDATGDPEAFERAIAQAPPALVATSRRVVVALGLARGPQEGQ